MLTQDAQRLRLGTAVILQGATRLPPLQGRVKRIEPAGFTRLPTLGVERKRVRVIVRLVGRPRALGVGYRLQARFWTASRAQALSVPGFAVLLGTDGKPYVLVVREGVLRGQPVRLGLREELRVEVADGLHDGGHVVRVLEASMTDGVRVRARDAAEEP